ncbi:MAG: HlyD family efflux transporter periplasmic adaptor subunit [Candidatus Brocadiae bacterium]|nr:HlyD family efflux transporter periplasmic adaptor subunit [Candidatus Brocadiia bacterium]
MIRKYVLPVLALAGAVLAAWTAFMGAQPLPAAQPAVQPARAPFRTSLAGAGLVEASTENIDAGAPVPGLVLEVAVRAGGSVRAGDPLFRLDDRELKAEVLVREAQLEAGRQKLARLRALPRAEDLPAVEARLLAAEADRDNARDELARVEAMKDKRAISEEDLSRRRWSARVAEAKAAGIRAELESMKAGAWAPDLAVAGSEVAAAQAQLDAARIAVDRLTVRAPVDADILRVDIRPGEYAMAGQSLVVLGATTTLHVRVDIDENDAWRFRPGAAAVGFVRGNSDLNTRMTFVRLEPYVIPKKSLTGSSSERVDTRVMQVLYAFERRMLPVYVGQQMDVVIEVEEKGEAR